MLRINKNQQLELCFQDILPNSTNLFTGLSMAARRENCLWNLGSYRVWPVAKQQTRLVTQDLTTQWGSAISLHVREREVVAL